MANLTTGRQSCREETRARSCRGDESRARACGYDQYATGACRRDVVRATVCGRKAAWLVIAACATTLWAAGAVAAETVPRRLNPLRTSPASSAGVPRNVLRARQSSRDADSTRPDEDPARIITIQLQALEEVQGIPSAAAPSTTSPSTAPAATSSNTTATERFGPIEALTIDTAPPAGRLPESAAAPLAESGDQSAWSEANRGWQPSVFCWEASAFCHRPLYFEEVNLERYGYARRLTQPLVSGVYFYGNVLALPYNMMAQKPHRCIYTLGHYRPGSHVPRQIHWPPLRVDAGLMEAGLVTGLVFIFP